MHTLPIFGITGRSLWFVLANLFSLFRLSWLPLAMLIATTYTMAHAGVRTVFFAFAILIGMVAARTEASAEALLETFSVDLYAKVGLALQDKLPNLNAILFEFFYIITVTAYTVAILSYAYKALKGFDVDTAIDGQTERSIEDDPTLHMPMGAQ